MTGPSSLARRAGIAGTLALAGLALAAPWVAPFDPFIATGAPSLPPGPAHWLGTNDIGQDILSELVYGTRTSLVVGLTAGLVSTLIGTAIGLAAGLQRGLAGAALARLIDLVIVLPFLPLVIVVAAYAGTSRLHVAGVLGAVMWARTARVVRAVTRSEVARDYVMAARGIGASSRRLAFVHLLPAVLPHVAAQLTQTVGTTIGVEASLAFLGLGDPTAKSWGGMLYYAQARSAFLTGQWVWWVIPPGLMIALAVLAFALLGLSIERPRSA